MPTPSGHWKFFVFSWKWLAITFAAGTVNSGGWLLLSRFLTHVTGFATLVGIQMAENRFVEALAVASVPVFFIAGCMIAAFLTDRRIQRGLDPMYSTPLLAASVLIGGGGALGARGFFGGGQGEHDYLLLAALSLACGLMNAVVTVATGTLMRATHMTGLTTDLGIGLVRAHFLDEQAGEVFLERRANLMRLASLISFILGSVVGCYLFLDMSYLGFVVPAAIVLIVALFLLPRPASNREKAPL